MTNFARNEIVSATQLVRQFSTFLNCLKEKSVKKVGIIRNNEMEAVILPIEEYEKLQDAVQKANRKSVRDYFGSMDEETYVQMEEALKDCRKVDADEW